LKHFISLLLVFLMLCGCAASPAPAPASSVSVLSSAEAEPIPTPEPEPLPPPVPAVPKAVSADPEWDEKQTIAAYFDTVYQSYLTMTDIDISGLLDTEQMTNQNLMVWLQMLNQRRRMLKEQDLCYVETEQFDYEIVYDEQAEDDRMTFWQRRMDDSFDAVFHLRLRGEEGKAYPPTFALNSQHSIFLRKIGGAWRIVRHYYPGAVRNFYFANGLELPSDQEALAQLKAEFAPAESIEPLSVPDGARVYDPELSTQYALTYAEQPNSRYYHVGDWRGNCQNFVSQCVSSGFGDDQNIDPMTKKWFAGSGGGTSPWENCDYFWNYAVESNGIGGIELSSVTQMQEGDILQLRSIGRGDPDDFSHVLFMADAEKGIFAQNSPPNFVYCSDLVNIISRFFRPVYLFSDY